MTTDLFLMHRCRHNEEAKVRAMLNMRGYEVSSYQMDSGPDHRPWAAMAMCREYLINDAVPVIHPSVDPADALFVASLCQYLHLPFHLYDKLPACGPAFTNTPRAPKYGMGHGAQGEPATADGACGTAGTARRSWWRMAADWLLMAENRANSMLCTVLKNPNTRARQGLGTQPAPRPYSMPGEGPSTTY